MKYKFLLLALTALLQLSAQQKFMPTKLYSFGPIAVQKPVLLDSVNLKDVKFSDETLLASAISFPARAFFHRINTRHGGFFPFIETAKRIRISVAFVFRYR